MAGQEKKNTNQEPNPEQNREQTREQTEAETGEQARAQTGLKDNAGNAPEESGNTVLCGANSYEEKYYFNPAFANIPKSIQEELQILTVLFTEECGGILTLEFTPEGNLTLNTRVSDFDYYYDEIEAGLKIRALQKEKKELFEALEVYYKVFFLGEKQ